MNVTNESPPAYGAVRIGNGTALHPARKDWYGVTATCGCPNTRNGYGTRGGQFFANTVPTCKRSGNRIVKSN